MLEIREARLGLVFINEELFCVCLVAVPIGSIGFFVFCFAVFPLSKNILRVKDLAMVQTEKRPGKVHVNMYKFHVISA